MGISVLDQRHRVVHCHSCQASRAIMLERVSSGVALAPPPR